MTEYGSMDPRAEASIRGMMAHTDERLQALSSRLISLETELAAMTNATRELRAAVSRGALLSGGAAGGSEEVSAQISALEDHLARAFQQLAKRDQELVGAIEARIHEETVRVASETHQKVEALEQVVRDSAELVASTPTAAPAQVVSTEGMTFDNSEIIEAFEERVVRLAALVRSDSTRIAEMVQQQGAEMKREMAQTLDQRLGRVSELVSATTMSAVAEVARGVPEQAAEMLKAQMEGINASIDNNFVELADLNETEMHRMGRYISERTAELIDATIADRMSAAVERINSAANAIQAGSGGMGEAASEDIAAIVDERVTALAKMIRSDNQTMAEIVNVAAEQQAAKQANRAVKELAATLPAQISELVERRFAELEDKLHGETQSTMVAVAKVADVMSSRMDDVENRYTAGVERAAERLGDAVANAMERSRRT
jgi:hypothetical protein